MRILINIAHPGHVHFYKYAIWKFQECGHEVLIAARDKDMTLALLNHYNFPYRTISRAGNGRWGMLKEFLQRSWTILRLSREFDPGVVTGIGGASIAPVCKLLGKPLIIFDDSEPIPRVEQFFEYNFATVICTPDCFMRDLGKHHIRYAGYHELAYLHPDYFWPDPTVLEELKVSAEEPFSILRFVSWKATHDLGHRGFSDEAKREIVKTLSRYGRVFVTSETPLPREFEPYRITVQPHRIHSVLYYARLFLGDGATMATEAAILGTPAVRSSSLALTMGNFLELMNRYELVYSYYEWTEALCHAVQLLEQEDVKVQWRQRREQLLVDKIDVTAWMVDFIEGYPDTFVKKERRNDSRN